MTGLTFYLSGNQSGRVKAISIERHISNHQAILKPILRILAFCILFLFVGLPAKAQDDTPTYLYQNWLGLMTSTQISERFSLWNDAHYVNKSFFIYRTGITYHSKQNRTVTTVGYARLLLTAPFSDGNLVRDEHRAWAQIIYRLPGGPKFGTSFRFRYDARFRENLLVNETGSGYDLSHRFRFNAVVRYNWGKVLTKNHDFTTSLLNESLFMDGAAIDQTLWEHRTFLMFGLSKGGNTYSMGYVMRFMDLNPSLTRINHGLVLWATIHFDLRKIRRPSLIIHPTDHI